MMLFLGLACTTPDPTSQPVPVETDDTSTPTEPTAPTDDACPPVEPVQVCIPRHLATSTPSDGEACLAHVDCPLDQFCGEGQCRSLAGSMGTVCAVRSTFAVDCGASDPSMEVLPYLERGEGLTLAGTGRCVVEFGEAGCFPYDLGRLADEGLTFDGTLLGSRVRVVDAINTGCVPLRSFRTPGRVDTIAVWYP